MSAPAQSKFDKTINEALLPLTKDNIVADLIRLLVIIFATKIIPPLPDAVTNPLNNTLFRFMAVFVILWLGNQNPTRSAAMALGFVVAINLMSNRGPFESPAEGFGLLANIHDPDIYYMHDRAKQEADYRYRSLQRRDPNRVHAIVRENNLAAQKVLMGEANTHAEPIQSIQQIPFQIDSPVDDIVY